MNNKLWIVPQNTLEQKTISELLLRTNELLVTTTQIEKPSWENLESKIQDLLTHFEQVYGIQLEGKSPSNHMNIVPYIDEETQETVYPLEQVAKILNCPLTIDEQFILANSKGYIPAMIQLGKSLHLSNTFEKIQEVRMKDRQMQGVSQQQENAAIKALAQATDGLPKTNGKYPLVSVQLPHFHFSTIIDRLYGMYENLLITDPNTVTHFYGSKDALEQLQKDFEDGYTDQKETDGFYYWKASIDPAAIQNSLLSFIQERNTMLEDDRIKHLTPHDILNEQNIDEKVGRVMIETPKNLRHLSQKSSPEEKKVARKFYENGSLYYQEGIATLEPDNPVQWHEPQKESDYPLSYEEKVLVLIHSGPYDLKDSLLSKISNKTLIPDMIDALRQARFNTEQFTEMVQAREKDCCKLDSEVTRLKNSFGSFISVKRDNPEPYPDYKKWCKQSYALSEQRSELSQLKCILAIAEQYESVIQDYEKLYFEANRPKTSEEKKQLAIIEAETKKEEGIEPFDDE